MQDIVILLPSGGRRSERARERLSHVPSFPLSLVSLYLQQQTFLQASGSDSCRVEVLQNLQRFLNLLFRCIDVMIDSQLVADAVERFPKQSVIIQRPNQVFDDLPLLIGQFVFRQLTVYLIVERNRITIDYLLVVCIVLLLPPTFVYWQLIIAAHLL